MQIEEGREYRTRDGRKVGPMMRYEQEQTYWIEKHLDGRGWTENGEGVWQSSGEDLISLWQDETSSPIQRKIVKTVEPGCYGRIKVTGTYQGNRITIDWEGSERVTNAVPIVGLSASELRAAAITFTQLADFLEEQGK